VAPSKKRRAGAWRTADPLYRGDSKTGVGHPDPTAPLGIVEHVLYHGEIGRSTPFSSVSESKETAEHFAGRTGRIWRVARKAAVAQGAIHIPRSDLVQLLRGYGKGKAKWDDAFEVAQARAYVERWSEHLFDWAEVDPSSIPEAIRETFE
jgi:hypothetical protein